MGAFPIPTGELAGNCEVVELILILTNNPNKKVLGFQRSRLASNIFGARIDLKKPIALGPSGKVVHVLINRPMEGRCDAGRTWKAYETDPDSRRK
mgnify:CR=1 FL=1